MSKVLRSPKDFWAGLMYSGFGGAALLIARDYGMGSASRMGPGYFPTVLGGLLLVIGVTSLLRGFLTKGEPLGAIAWKGMILVSGATVAFGLLLRPLGLIAALLGLILISALASVKFRLEAKAIAAMVGLIVFCGLVFVVGLGLPTPLLGTLLGG